MIKQAETIEISCDCVSHTGNTQPIEINITLFFRRLSLKTPKKLLKNKGVHLIAEKFYHLIIF